MNDIFDKLTLLYIKLVNPINLVSPIFTLIIL